MKKIGLCAAVAGSAIVLMTSCLGETKNSQKLSGIPGVVTTASGSSALAGDKKLVDIGSFLLYSPILDQPNLEGGDCVVTSFEVDYSSPENANAGTTGYYNATISDCVKVDKYNLQSFSLPADTASLLEKEKEVAFAVNPKFMHSYLKGYQFLWSGIKLEGDETIDWRLYYDPSKVEPVEEDGLNAYSVFLRVVETREATKEKESNQVITNAFYVQNLISLLNNKEKGEGNDFYTLHVYYVKEIKDGKPVWDFDSLSMQVEK